MYFNNFIQGGTLVAALILPPSVVNAPTGPTITRILEKQTPDDRREAYQLRGVTQAVALEITQAVALEKIYHQALDDMPKIKRARTARVEWFEQPRDPKLANAKAALQSVGQGIYYDFDRFPRNVMPSRFDGRQCTGKTHTLQSAR